MANRAKKKMKQKPNKFKVGFKISSSLARIVLKIWIMDQKIF
jgi:hypothetical protein